MDSQRKPKLWEALVPVLGMTAIIVVAILQWGMDPHIPIVIACVLAALMAKKIGCSWLTIRSGIIESVYRAIEALIIIMIVGMLIGSWVLGGIVPGMVYYGLELISPKAFLLTGAILCAIVSLATGSSWTSSGTIGVALMGIAAGLGINPALAAGMVISGAYFGDKLSPLSDSTNIAAATAEADLYDHVGAMMYTTIPSFIIALILYGIIGIQFSKGDFEMSRVKMIQDALQAQFNITPWIIIPPLVVIISAIKKVPAIPSLLMGTAIGGLWAMLFQNQPIQSVLNSLHYGYVSESGIEIVDKLLSRGGVDSMMWTISLIIFALAFGGILEKAKFAEVIMENIITKIKTVGGLVTTTIIMGIVSDFVLTDQYLSILVPGRMLAPLYDKMGLQRRFLSRTLEDGGTLWSPMFPWNGCGAYQSATLGVATFAYFPFAFMNLINPVYAIITTYLGIGILRKKIKDATSNA